ncbi:DUF3306 domain-containing protein [Noviherbaspirillum galbum]|uniref:DUF3306 domain-containing protein n=1 Tax=Noviherbaspirillum galbum TaxID=2709383 RepID=A0A6B3SYP4_9BURK|nr:DUF3306 domain-containing protein [Noviherbaspirillum galbum]NEX63199.1 DUF3306 domain-containing protein [Noviherbaspirillum galbum]
MEAESFFSRWSRRKSEAREQEAPAAPGTENPPAQQSAEQPAPAPTMEDVAKLTPDSDFTRFVAGGVDETVRRSALKKLFADPHFNVMDGLDVYIEDFNKFDPIPPAMLAALNHAKSVLNPLDHLGKPVMAMLDAEPKEAEHPADQEPAAAEHHAEADAAREQPGLQEAHEAQLPAQAEPEALNASKTDVASDDAALPGQNTPITPLSTESPHDPI